MQGVQIKGRLTTSDDLGFSLQTIYLALNRVACLVRTSKMDHVVKATIGDHGEGMVHISMGALDAAMAMAAAARAERSQGQEQPEEQVAAAEAASAADAAKVEGGTHKHKGKHWPAAALYVLHLSLDGKVSLG